MADNKNFWAVAEEDILNFWDKAKIFQKTIDRPAESGNFVFYEGPPTANGRPGIHHVLARSFKDVIPRYKSMNGFKVLRKAGWDTHGLPVELQVEKELKISGKPDIEKYGIFEFNQKCRESVWKFKDEWEKMTRRIAFWLDLEHPYITYDNSYIESLWWIISQANAKNLLYRGHKVVPHCPRCGTALSTHEVAQGYKLVKDNSLYINFKITKGNNLVSPGDFILAWTTTPWTLPGNVALAVGEGLEYVKVKSGGDNYILAKKRLADVFKTQGYEILETFDGEDLVGVEYEPLFKIDSILASGKKAYYVSLANFVTTEDGSGVVHTAVMYGEDDYDFGHKLDLPKIHTVDENGNFSEELKAYGLGAKFVKDEATEKIIIDVLQKDGRIFKEEVYEHDYPYCWRCDTPLLYYAKDSWFLQMSSLREELIKNNSTINWIPSHIKEGRFGEWLTNVKDWAISRERYWGTPLPIWECACGGREVISSVESLSKKSGQAISLESDLHRPAIDNINIPCPSCAKPMTRVKEVFDCWFDSGAMPLAQHHYPFENKALIDSGEQYPAEFICEAIDQTRGWFYTLLALGTILGKGSPYKNVICLGHINDKYGKKMSKSKGNIVDPWEVMDAYGADAVRLHMYTINQPGEGKRYDLEDVKEVFRQNIMLILNIYKFYELYADPKGSPDNQLEPKSDNILDQWILLKLNKLIIKLTADLDKYHIYESAREIPIFINELSTWYLRRSRDRFKSEDETDKQQVLGTMSFVLLSLAKLMAPFMPFISEQLYQKITGANYQDDNLSVHLSIWPKAQKLKDDLEILSKMDKAREIVEMGLSARDKSGIKVRQVLAKITVSGLKEELDQAYQDLITDELNVKEMMVSKKGDQLQVDLDTVLTPELKLEGLKREVVRSINQLRKEAGLTVGDLADVIFSEASGDLGEVLKTMAEAIKKETFSRDLKVEAISNNLIKKDIKLDDYQLTIALNK